MDVKVQIKKSGNQCEIMIGRRRVGYVGFGENMPINFLNKATSGVSLTKQERIEAAEKTREQMETLNREREAMNSQLRSLVSSDYQVQQKLNASSDEGTTVSDDAESQG